MLAIRSAYWSVEEHALTRNQNGHLIYHFASVGSSSIEWSVFDEIDENKGIQVCYELYLQNDVLSQKGVKANKDQYESPKNVVQVVGKAMV